MRRTVANAKASRIPIALNMSSSDSRFLGFLNSALERLINEAEFWGTTQKYTVSVTSNLLALPPQFAVPLAFAVSQCPIPIRDQWYEFTENGWGVRNDTDTCNWQAMYRGNFPIISDIVAGSKKLRFQCDLAADIGKTVLALGYDDSGNWIRTMQGGVWLDGEVITLAQSPGTLSVNNFAKLTDIQKPVTSGQVWLYEWNGTVNRLIGQYQYFETNPSYPRYQLPITGTTATQIDLIGKIAFIPMVNDTDYLPIGNLEALRLACRSLLLEENLTKLEEAALLWNGRKDARGQVIAHGAITLLEKELEHYKGAGVKPTMQFDGGGPEPVPALL